MRLFCRRSTSVRFRGLSLLEMGYHSVETRPLTLFRRAKQDDVPNRPCAGEREWRSRNLQGEDQTQPNWKQAPVRSGFYSCAVQMHTVESTNRPIQPQALSRFYLRLSRSHTLRNSPTASPDGKLTNRCGSTPSCRCRSPAL